MGFSPHWDYKSYGENISEKIIILSTTDKVNSRHDVIDRSLLNGVRQPLMYNFVLDRPPGYRAFCQPERTHCEKKQICFEYYNITFER